MYISITNPHGAEESPNTHKYQTTINCVCASPMNKSYIKCTKGTLKKTWNMILHHSQHTLIRDTSHHDYLIRGPQTTKRAGLLEQLWIWMKDITLQLIWAAIVSPTDCSINSILATTATNIFMVKPPVYLYHMYIIVYIYLIFIQY